MSLRQQILSKLYPAIMFLSHRSGKAKKATVGITRPFVSFYALSAVLNDGQPFLFDKLIGKKVLIVNTASDCGYTRQYEELQKLYDLNKGKLCILAFPSNDFKNQEQGSNEEIAAFCKKNYGINFPLMEKTIVLPLFHQHAVYEWLTKKEKNGWNEQAPSWNFCKYLISENGELTHFFDKSISPLSNTIKQLI